MDGSDALAIGAKFFDIQATVDITDRSTHVQSMKRGGLTTVQCAPSFQWRWRLIDTRMLLCRRLLR
jgi:hypothetical protein